MELSEPSASGNKPSDAKTKMKKRVSLSARTPALSEMAADAAEDMAKEAQHIAPVDYNPGLVDHSSSLGLQPSSNVMQWMSYSK